MFATKDSDKKLIKICLIVPYFGKWPNYFKFFLKSCEMNPTINWLFYTNCKTPDIYPDNVKFIKADLDDFNKLASEKLGLKIEIKYPYKLCDFKPAYGHIFEDYLDGFDFWGYADIDMIYGNIRKFLVDEILFAYDIITGYEKYLAGPFTIYKKNFSNLYRGNSDYKKSFLSQETVGFDETNLQYDKNMFAKEYNDVAGKTKIKSMTHYIVGLRKERRVKVFAENLIHNIKPGEEFNAEFASGNLVSESRDLFAAHFLMVRLNGGIMLPNNGEAENKFFINECGISYNKISRIKQKLRSCKIIATNKAKVFVGTFLQKNIPTLYFFIKNYKYKKSDGGK